MSPSHRDHVGGVGAVWRPEGASVAAAVGLRNACRPRPGSQLRRGRAGCSPGMMGRRGGLRAGDAGRDRGWRCGRGAFATRGRGSRGVGTDLGPRRRDGHVGRCNRRLGRLRDRDRGRGGCTGRCGRRVRSRPWRGYRTRNARCHDYDDTQRGRQRPAKTSHLSAPIYLIPDAGIGLRARPFGALIPGPILLHRRALNDPPRRPRVTPRGRFPGPARPTSGSSR